MKKMSIREARQSLSRLEEILAVDGEIAITKRGKEIARILPIARSVLIPSHRNLREKMAVMTSPSEAIVRQDRDAR